MRYACTGFDRAGVRVTELVDALDPQEAAEAARRKGLYATEVVEAKGGAAARAVSAPGAFRRTRRAGKPDDLAAFTRQLALLVSTGTPLVDAMESLAKQAPPGPWRDVVADLRRQVEEGGQLSEAMASHPGTFDAVCRSLVAAGEQGGRLDVMLARLAKLTRQQVKIRKTVVGALVYPCLLIVVSIVVLIAMLGFVMPRFEGLFESLGSPLPPTTKILMAASGVLRSYWYAFVGAAIAVGVGLRFYLSTPGGRLARDRAMVHAPQLGRVTRSFATARIARMLGVLLEGKVSLLESLALTKLAMGNALYADLITRAEEAVIRGENVSAALGDPALISPSVCEAIRSGERTGQVAPVLASVAEFLDEDNEVLLRTITGLLEPVILIVLGLVVGMVAISMFLPLFDLTAAGGGPA